MTNPLETCSVHLRIYGRVQGVYYRASMLQEAQQLQLTGWVRNCPDGSVEAVAEGGKAKLNALIAWCHQGPEGARVAGVDAQWQRPEHSFVGFAIRR
jgi:acylphosphatase